MWPFIVMGTGLLIFAIGIVWYDSTGSILNTDVGISTEPGGAGSVTEVSSHHTPSDNVEIDK